MKHEGVVLKQPQQDDEGTLPGRWLTSGGQAVWPAGQKAASAGNVTKADKVHEVSLGESAPMQRTESIQNTNNDNKKGKRDVTVYLLC